ncbi:MAG: glycosyltransferase [Desulfuromonadales bacterium]
MKSLDIKNIDSPVSIKDHKWPDYIDPFVSIVCITYNQEKFISECLDSFLIQETSFPFEILIHDDASKDNTANIIRNYQ